MTLKRVDALIDRVVAEHPIMNKIPATNAQNLIGKFMIEIQKQYIRYLLSFFSTLATGALTFGLAWLAGFNFEGGPELALIVMMSLIVAAIAFINVQYDV